MTGAPLRLGASLPGILIAVKLWSSESRINRAAPRPDFETLTTFFRSLSAAYHPPQRAYLTLDEIVKRFPGFGYQLYLADNDTPKEIEHNVRVCGTSQTLTF